MWRVEDDVWDTWSSVKRVYFGAEKWAAFDRRGHWPDADMLPFGHIGIRGKDGPKPKDRFSLLSRDEQETLFTFWCIFRSPLMFGGDLVTLDDYTRSLLTKRELIAIDQHSTGNRLVYSRHDVRIWTAEIPKVKQRYVAVFNLGESPSNAQFSWKQVGISSTPRSIRSLWSGTIINSPSKLSVQLAPHASELYRIVNK
jgi:hypothetical protein